MSNLGQKAPKQKMKAQSQSRQPEPDFIGPLIDLCVYYFNCCNYLFDSNFNFGLTQSNFSKEKLISLC